VTPGIGKSLAVVSLAVALFIPGTGLIAQSGALSYSLVDLGTLGGATSEAFDVNNLGDVVGTAATPNGPSHAFLYRNGEMVDLGTLVGGTASQATAISDAGIVAGSSGINAYGPSFPEDTQGFVWQDGSMVSVGTLHCPCSFNRRHGTSRALGLNNANRVVGDSPTGRASFRGAFLWQSNQIRGLISLAETTSDSTAYGISDADEIVGEIGGRAFVARGNLLTDVGMLPGDVRSRGRTVNIIGQVAGDSLDAAGVPRAFVWDLGRMRALGTLPGDAASEALAINASGDIVGRSGNADFSRSRAVVWRGGAAIDLNQQVTAGDWVLTVATAINDLGQIAGAGLRGGQLRAFRLDPR
jgi:probable HAF family extracellular repeat protein